MLNINQQVLDHTASVQFDHFEQRCLNFLREHFPELEAADDANSQIDAVRSSIQLAGFRGFHEEVDVIQFCYLRQLLGSGFDVGNNPISRCLNDQTMDPGERISQAMDLMADLLERSGTGTR